ncbi:aquaporin [Mycoplasmopsis lipofaciens]|uniref:aquaporin n=1 Tax=Mycoplasmopsis lipofaciens TaxID=114884 RepID=UPI000486FAB1|nr:aquaporin [Mycoplasmopsis lipofaciens]
MFKFFKIKKEERLQANEPQYKKAWVTHMLSELIGSIWISLGLAGLSIIIQNKPLEVYLLHNVIVGFFAGFIIVGSCLFIFGRWSVDLNPVVTLYRWLNGTNTTRYAFIKIFFQLIGGIIAGLIIYGIGHFTSDLNFANFYISPANSSNKDFIVSNNISNPYKMDLNGTINQLMPGTFWILFVELVISMILLFPIFSPRIDNKYRDLFIMLIISFDVWMGILAGSAAINPIRGLAQQVPTLFFDMNKMSHFKQQDILLGTLAMIIGDLLAPFVYALFQGWTEKYFNNWILKAINFKNHKIDDYVKNK